MTTESIQSYVSGPQHLPTQSSQYHSRGAVSHQWKGPGFYLPHPESRFTYPNEVVDPIEQGFDRNTIKSKGLATVGPYQHNNNPMDNVWPGRPVFHSVSQNKWINEHPVTSIPRDARLFYNEEDWDKWCFMARNPSLPGIQAKIQAENSKKMQNNCKKIQSRATASNLPF